MKPQLKCILLVDDDEPTNYLHQDVLEDTGISKNVIVAETAAEALQLLKRPKVKDCKVPDIIFLDLNMPGMNGWDFIEKYTQLKHPYPKKPLIYVLTTSTNPADKKKAAEIKEITGFMSKPLTEDMVMKLVRQHFPD